MVIQRTCEDLPRPRLPHHNTHAHKHHNIIAYTAKGSHRQPNLCLPWPRLPHHCMHGYKHHADHTRRQNTLIRPTEFCFAHIMPLRPHHATATATTYEFTSSHCNHIAAFASCSPAHVHPTANIFYECTIATRCETHVHHAAPLQRWGKPPPHHHFRQEASLLDSLLVKRRAFLRVCSGHFLSHRPEVPQVVIPQVTVPPSATKEFHKVTEGLGCVGERLGALGER